MWPAAAAGPLVGLGCMRLSTDPGRDEARGLAVLHAAFDAGITFLDTADAYCWSDEETGHNERLIARALATWSGEATRIIVATKGGLTRPGGRWASNGRATHLRAACEASCRALGVERIALYQLHALDPRTPLTTSVRALASLQRDGLIEHIGLCNVTVGQIEEARSLADIAAVQVELSVWNDGAVMSGVAEYCAAHGIRLIAYRPLGGPARARRTARDKALAAVAARHDATAQEIAIAWLMDLDPSIAPIPGATRVETAQSTARAAAIHLTDEDRTALAERFPTIRVAQPGAVTAAPTIAPREGEVVMIIGLPGAGKTTLARQLAADGFARVNRDEEGGSLRDLLPELTGLVEGNTTRIVLDNTYVSRKSRAPVLAWAASVGLPVRGLWLATSVEDAQVNAVTRMLATYGRLLGPEEMRDAVKTDVNAFGPGVQFRYQRDLEPPQLAEGFSRIDEVPFERARDPEGTNRGLMVWCDDLERVDGWVDVLRRYAAEGWRLLGLAWRPEISERRATAHDVEEGFLRMRERLGVPIDIAYCPHPAGPPICWCRKPLPGLGVAFIQKYRLDSSRSIYVGDGAQDRGFARRLGFQYDEPARFFTRTSTPAQG